MASKNNCNFIGNVVKDCELKIIQNSGKSVCNFTVAVNEKYNGEDKTVWIDCTAWDKLAETCAQYLKKGMQVDVSGRIKLEEYNNSNGELKSKLSLTLREMIMLGKKEE